MDFLMNQLVKRCDKMPEPEEDMDRYKQQSHLLPDSVSNYTMLFIECVQDEMQSSARCSTIVKPGTYLQFLEKNVVTAVDVVYKGMSVSSPSAPMLGRPNPFTNEYQWTTYQQAIEGMRLFGGGLVQLGLDPSPKTVIGIYATNSVEWDLAEYGAYHYSFAIAPIYDTLGSDACAHIINHAEVRLVVTDTNERIERLLRQSADTPTLAFIVTTQVHIQRKLYDDAKRHSVRLYTFAEVQSLGRQVRKVVLPESESLALICYTSGTSGPPKGALITHGNLLATVAGVMTVLKQSGTFDGDNPPTSISYLPLAHIFERLVHLTVFYRGGRVGFYSGDIKNLPHDLKMLRPTILPAVPRLLNRIYHKVVSGTSRSRLRTRLMATGLKAKTRELERGIIRRTGLWDRVVFRRVQAIFGGRVSLLITGSAPLSPTVMQFMRCALGCAIIEGYGQTECTGAMTLTLPGDTGNDHVGPPLPCCTIQLFDVPEMDYYVSLHGVGEICVKGTNVFSGYFKDPEKTAEAIDGDGWLHTGDIGRWTARGTLQIVDRKKHIFKLSQGEYIAPEKIENVYQQSSFVGQCFVDGNSSCDYLLAVVVPDVDALNSWCIRRNILLSLDQACNQKLFKEAVLNDMLAIGRREGLTSLQQVRDIYLHPEAFSIENDLVTPTLKLKRHECRRHFKHYLDRLYERVEADQQSRSPTLRH